MKILVAGATGTIGGHMVAQLNQAGHQVLALTRNPEKANFPAGVQVVKGDLTQPETFAKALEGVEGLHLIKFGGNNYADLETGNDIVAMAEKAGVKRVTVLMGGQKGAFEEAIEASTMAWTFLQPVEFMFNVLEWAEPIRAKSELSLGFVDRKTAIVHEADIAAVGAKALTEDGHSGKTYTITGSEVLSPRKMIEIISKAMGREIKLIELSEAQVREQLEAAGQTQDIIEFFMWVYGNTPPIGYTVVPTVEEVTGQRARTFAQWVDEHIGQFRS